MFKSLIISLFLILPLSVNATQMRCHGQAKHWRDVAYSTGPMSKYKDLRKCIAWTAYQLSLIHIQMCIRDSNKRVQNIILKADREQMPDFVSPEYESAIFVIAKKDSDYFAFVDKSYSKIKMLLEKLSPVSYTHLSAQIAVLKVGCCSGSVLHAVDGRV